MKFTLTLLLLCLPAAAWAKANGLASNGCSGCHGGGATHPVTITSSNPAPNPGQAVTLTITLQGGGSGGLYLHSGVGTFANLSGATRLFLGEPVHASPRPGSGGQVVFQVQWTAPTAAGGTDFEAWTVLGNGNNSSSGDSTGYTRINLVWGCAGIPVYGDLDQDGWGAADRGTTRRCTAVPGWADKLGDCNDNDDRVNPSAIEACNGKDENCNGQLDEGLTMTTTWPDADKDGFGAINGAPATGCSSASRASNNQDCNDADPKMRPGATEICNAFDDDCDSMVDEGVKIRCGVGWCARYGPTCNPALCMPGEPIVETCNYFDDDCDGVDDNGITCPGGEECLLGQCVPRGTQPDAGLPLQPDGGTAAPPVKSGCASAPGSFALLALLAAARRRRRRLS
ncbi:MAG: repeat domain protein [Myxococcaceae bacterium]|nr:repeat domain protein [Myxococcaceae bacterium]